MAYELSGKVKLIKDTEQFSSGFTKREMVVTVADGNYPQDINLEFLKDKTSLLDSVSVGQEVTVSFDIRGREYNGRYFNNLVGWKIQASGDGAQEQPSYQSENTAPAGGFDAFDEDIPF